MKWQKRGRVFQNEETRAWSVSHAQVPTIFKKSDKCWRIFYSTRNIKNQSSIGFVDIDPQNPTTVIYSSESPVLTLGKLGCFDDAGVMPSWVVDRGRELYLYYIGWNLRGTVPYSNAIGLAVSRDNGETFERLFEGPVIDRNTREPYFCGTACVMIDDGTWRCWYLASTGWDTSEGKPEPLYHIKYAESRDGIDWKRDGTVAIDFQDSEEGGIASASVLKCDGNYRMWYSVRKRTGFRKDLARSYRIGYALSRDGIHWERRDTESGIDVSATGWDSEMIAYPQVVSRGGKILMFYNGNGFGQTGFGVAEADIGDSKF